MRLLVFLLIGLFSLGAAALPERFSAAYTLTLGDLTIGQAKWSLVPEGDGNYRYDAVTLPKGVASLFYKSHRAEHSKWQYKNGRVRPLLYRYHRQGDEERNVEIVFDWQGGGDGHGFARHTINGKTWKMSVAPDILDKNIYVLALMQDLEEGRRNFQYAIADGGKTKIYRFSFMGEEPLGPVLGHERIDTLVIKRVRESVARETTFWCAPRFGYLPVKVLHREKDGSVITLRIDTLDLE